MMRIILTLLTILIYSLTYSQTLEEFYNSRNYHELIKYDSKSDELTGEQLYMVGYAYFQLENDDKAIEFYDKAISKGLNDGSVHFYKGLSLRYEKRYNEAIIEIEIAIKMEPANQEFMNEKGVIYYNEGEIDKALEVFEQAKKLPKTYPEPYFWVAAIYHDRQDYKKALILYYEALDSMSSDNSYYEDVLVAIGQLEYTFTFDYKKSAKAYSRAIALDPKNYILYPKLMKAYNAENDFEKADSIFALMKVAYKNKELSEDIMNFKNVAIDEFDWNGQKATVYKYLVDPKESLDIFYKIYLLNKEGNKVERTFLVEQTIKLPDGPKYLLCEKDKSAGMHYTYPYGWNDDIIPLDDLRKEVVLVLDGKMKYQAASKF